MSDPGGVWVGAAAVLTGIGAICKVWWDARRSGEHDPVALLTEANRAAYDALQGIIVTLQGTVADLGVKLAATEAALSKTIDKMAEMQADLLETKNENRQLRTKVTQLSRLLTKKADEH